MVYFIPSHPPCSSSSVEDGVDCSVPVLAFILLSKLVLDLATQCGHKYNTSTLPELPTGKHKSGQIFCFSLTAIFIYVAYTSKQP